MGGPVRSTENGCTGGSIVQGTVLTQELAALQSVLRSKILYRAPNMARILEYVCRKHLEGRGEQIKEYTIAIEALGRPSAFDPTLDSIVRVEVSRLRQRLAQYYKTEGAGDTVRIVLPESGYNPRFVSGAPARQAEPESAGAKPEAVEPVEDEKGRVFSRGRTWLVIAVAPVLMAALILWALPRRKASSSTLAAVSPVSNNGLRGVPVALSEEGVRISVGSLEPKYVDSSGRVWVGDRYFTGGHTVIRKDQRIFRTLDPALYEKAREGDFQYDIPLAPGVYELHLHFAEFLYTETLENSGVGWRRFHVILNGNSLLNDFDIIMDAPGTNTADERVFKDVTPDKDGYLHIRFASVASHKAFLSGIEVLPATPGKMRPVFILAAFHGCYDRLRQFWTADRYFQGGNLLLRSPVESGTTDSELFVGERFGNFSYFIPVVSGQYALTLRFAESTYSFELPGMSRGPIGLERDSRESIISGFATDARERRLGPGVRV